MASSGRQVWYLLHICHCPAEEAGLSVPFNIGPSALVDAPSCSGTLAGMGVAGILGNPEARV